MTVRYPILPPGVLIKLIPGYSAYHASSDGRIWSRHRTGYRRLFDDLKEMHPTISKAGYPRVEIVSDEGTPQLHFVHRLILLAFVGPCPEGMEGCHDPDPTPTNCKLENLRWDTRQANRDDMTRAGRGVLGVRNGRAILDDDQIREIRHQVASGVSRREISRQLGINRASIGHIVSGKQWKHVSGAPTIPTRPPLTEIQAALVISLGMEKMKRKDIARRFGITPSNVSLIQHGKSWKHLHVDERWKQVIMASADPSTDERGV